MILSRQQLRPKMKRNLSVLLVLKAALLREGLVGALRVVAVLGLWLVEVLVRLGMELVLL